MIKTGVLLVNLGTPDSPADRDVWNYLTEFLLDRRVIDISRLKREILVRGIIIPFRYKNSAKTYRKIWTEEGSPLYVYSQSMRDRLQERLGDDFEVELAMRYQNPSIEQALLSLQKSGASKLIVLPLFPQYASATTGSVHERVMDIVKGWWTIPEMQFVNSYPTHERMIDGFVKSGEEVEAANHDYILFSFHGVPERHITKSDCHNVCLKKGCCSVMTEKNQFCYRAQCVATATAIADKMNLSSDQWQVTFQSRLGKEPWLSPATGETIQQLAKQGKRRVAVFCPSFVCDCLETIYEIGIEYAEEFHEAGGEELTLVPGLQGREEWIDALEDLVRARVEVYRQPLAMLVT
jgi:ferrochelatase